MLPMQRVFSRFGMAMETDRVGMPTVTSTMGVDQYTSQKVTTTTVLTDACHRIEQRAIELSERVEERRAQSFILRRDERVASTGRPTHEPKDSVTYSPWGTSVGKPGFAKIGTPMSIDLDRLTDQVVRQIDNKIVAHRERMGKVF
jgi:hypothetical protein